MGWPDLDEMTLFGREVLPRVREAEAREVNLAVSRGDMR